MMLTVLVTGSVSPNAFYMIAAILTMINRTWVQISQFSSGVGAWRLPAASSINWHGLLEKDPVTNFVLLPYYLEDEAMLGRTLNILTALFRRRDKFATRSTRLAQKVLSGMKVVTPRLILHHASIGSRCLPRLVTAWACWLQADFQSWVNGSRWSALASSA